MYKKCKKGRSKKGRMAGGFFEGIGNTLSNWGSSISQGASNAWNSTKKAISPSSSSSYLPYSSNSSSSYLPYSSNSSSSSNYNYSSYGGKNKTRRKHHRKSILRISGGTIDTNISPSVVPSSSSSNKLVNRGGGRKSSKSRKCKK